jgi:hypothetical protein
MYPKINFLRAYPHKDVYIPALHHTGSLGGISAIPVGLTL